MALTSADKRHIVAGLFQMDELLAKMDAEMEAFGVYRMPGFMPAVSRTDSAIGKAFKAIGMKRHESTALPIRSGTYTQGDMANEQDTLFCYSMECLSTARQAGLSDTDPVVLAFRDLNANINTLGFLIDGLPEDTEMVIKPKWVPPEDQPVQDASKYKIEAYIIRNSGHYSSEYCTLPMLKCKVCGKDAWGIWYGGQGYSHRLSIFCPGCNIYLNTPNTPLELMGYGFTDAELRAQWSEIAAKVKVVRKFDEADPGADKVPAKASTAKKAPAKTETPKKTVKKAAKKETPKAAKKEQAKKTAKPRGRNAVVSVTYKTIELKSTSRKAGKRKKGGHRYGQEERVRGHPAHRCGKRPHRCDKEAQQGEVQEIPGPGRGEDVR